MTTKIMGIILLICTGIIACKKENTTPPKTTQDKLLGKWNWVTDIENDFYNGTSHVTTYPLSAGSYWEFGNDGKVIQYDTGGTLIYDFAIVSDTQVWFVYPGNVYVLKTLTANDLQLYKKVVTSATEYYETTTTFKK